MGDARSDLLDRLVAEVAAGGLADRSLRELAAAVDSSHRMLIYHFGSREGLVAAIVDAVEAAQRDLLRLLAVDAPDPRSLVLALWERVSSPELRPFVRLFFETVAASAGGGGDQLTAPWLDDSEEVVGRLGVALDPVDLRLGVAVTRGLLVDVLVSGEVAPATESLHRFLERWPPGESLEVDLADPSSPAAQHCLSAYAAELDERFATGFDPDQSRTVALEEVRPPAGRFLVATRHGRPMGCIGLKVHDGWGEIKRMWVSPDARGTGLGRRLLAAIETEAHTAGVDLVRLDTNAALQEAIALYRSAGYREVAAYNDEPYADLWFEKRLELAAS